MQKKVLIPLAMLAVLGLVGCDDPNAIVSWPSTFEESSKVANTTAKAAGVINYQGETADKKAEILGDLEGYGMANHLCGIPMYDDGGYTEISARLTLPTRTYITNYGYGTANGTIDPTGQMYSATIDEAVEAWKPYFHSYTTADSGTLNGWDAEGQDVSDRCSEIYGNLFDVKMTDDKTAYAWRGALSKDSRPIPLDDNGNEVTYVAGKLYKKWRIHVKTGDDAGAVYATKSTKFASFNGRKIALDDYLTPVKAMCGVYGGEKLKRGADIGTASAGFKGVSDFSPAKYDPVAGDWTTTGVAYQKAADGSTGIDIEYVSAKTQFNAMYAIADTLFAPVPEDFIKALGTDAGETDAAKAYAAGIKLYGQVGAQTAKDQAGSNTLSTGAYMVSYWESDKEMVYEKNPNYYFANEINFPGVTEVVFAGTGNDVAAYKAYLANQLDMVSVPTSYVKDHKSDANALHTPGSTTLKMNTNSCTQDEWDYYFGENGTMYPHKAGAGWDVKALMSDDDFLDGVFFSIDRSALAEKTGHNPALGYLSDAYMVDPEQGVSYRGTAAGKAAIAKYTSVDQYGKSDATAQKLFKKAMSRAVANGAYKPGSKAEPTTISLTYYFRYQSTIDNIGSDIASYIETNFNTACPGFKLVLDEEVAGASYVDCYTKMDHGEYDFADGAITGSALDPLNFMNTLCTNSLASGFCLNWGERTDVVNTYNPIIFDGKAWSYDALWTASSATAVVEEGLNKPVFKDAGIGTNKAKTATIFEEDYYEITDSTGASIWSFALAGIDFYAANADFSVYAGTSFDSDDMQYTALQVDTENKAVYGMIANGLIDAYVKAIGNYLAKKNKADITISTFEIDFKINYSYKNSDGDTVTATYSSYYADVLATIGVDDYTATYTAPTSSVLDAKIGTINSLSSAALAD